MPLLAAPSRATRLVLAALAAAQVLSCYAPAPLDCQVRCALDETCPHGMVCEDDFCRPKDHGSAVCQCKPGEERACGESLGECRQGVQRCSDAKTWSPCIGQVLPLPETCDGLDNDCDGQADDSPVDAPPCALTRGVCSGATHACVGGRYTAACAAEYGADYEALETKCDGYDNDCDGVPDGRSVGVVVDSALGYELVGLDGGFALAWGTPTDAGLTYSARLYDARFSPLGPPVALGASASATTLRGASAGGRAWFVWQHATSALTPSIDEAGGATVELSSPSGPAATLPGVLRPDMRGAIKLGADSNGLTAAWPGDGGVGVAQWPAAGGGPFVRQVVPPRPNFAEVYDLQLSSRGSTVSIAGKFFTDDAGTTDYFDGLLSLANLAYQEKFVFTGGTLVDSAAGTHAVYDGSCDYELLGFACRKSYLMADFDVWSTTSVRTEVRLSSPGLISGSHATAAQLEWVVSWVENGSLYIGRPLTNSRTVRPTRVPVGGWAKGPTRIANAGGTLSAIVYTSNPASGQLSAVLACSPP